MQTILGSGGAIGIEAAKALPQYTDKIRLVSRNPKKINDSDELYPADLTDPGAVKVAIKGSEVVYLLIGLPYRTDVWEKQWPLIMRATLDACKENGTRLVFFDNVYMYGKVSGPMTEETPYNPCSKKGEVRARIARMLTDELEAGNLQGLIARSADFYGPIDQNTIPGNLVVNKLKKNQTANWLLDLDQPHSLTYTPDAGKATALLGNTSAAFNQVWHLPTAKNPLTGREFISIAAKLLQAPDKAAPLSRFMIGLAGLFDRNIREMKEMLYQYERPYIFDSSKFHQSFFTATPYNEGIKKYLATKK